MPDENDKAAAPDAEQSMHMEEVRSSERGFAVEEEEEQESEATHTSNNLDEGSEDA